MALNISQFISAAEAGTGIKIKATVTETNVNTNIGGTDVKLTDAYYDLGQFHTAKQVLDSYDLRTKIVSGTLTADTGTIALSREPVV